MLYTMRQCSFLYFTVSERFREVTALYECVGPQLDWDPDIVAGLDVDFDYDDPDNILQDDFVAIAEGPVPESMEDDMQQELE